MRNLKELPNVIGHTVFEIETLFGNKTSRTLGNTLEIELSEGTFTCVFRDNRCREAYLFSDESEDCSPVCIFSINNKPNIWQPLLLTMAWN